MIPIDNEDPELYRQTRVYELCVFCGKTSKTWHFKTNNCVCGECAKTHKVSELTNWMKKK